MFGVAVKLALAAAAVWAVASFVPLHGRTVAERWREAGDLVTFVERGWAEANGAPPRAPSRAQARSPARDRPTEAHTEADRRAIDRILSDKLGERR